MQKLGVSEHMIVKISKEGNFFNQSWDLTLKRVHVIHAMYESYCIVKLIFVNNKGLIPNSVCDK